MKSFTIQGPHGLSNASSKGLLFWSASVGDREAGRLCIGYSIFEHWAFVGTVYVEAHFRRRGIGGALHEAAYAWAREHYCRFESGHITGEENQSYWEALERSGMAERIMTTYGPAFARKEPHERPEAKAG